jgi:H3 lysine-79-specific histone-lysine N-methyltransferase
MEATPPTDHLRMLRRAVALCDGPLFVQTLDTINSLLRTLKYPPLPSDTFAPPQPNALRAAVADWSSTGLPRAIALRIVEETYQRTVGPRTHELSQYQAFSDTVYGELMPSLVSRLLSLTGAGPGTLLLDLGSGVGNVVLHAALQSGCSAFGVEVMEKPSEMAREQRAQMMMRAGMWGVRMGDVELEHANMLESARVNKLMARADIVLVNNKVFGEKCTSLFCFSHFFMFLLIWSCALSRTGINSERSNPTEIPRLEGGCACHFTRAVCPWCGGGWPRGKRT